METTPAHLAERIADRLRGIGGLAAPEPAPERDIRRLVSRDVGRRPVFGPQSDAVTEPAVAVEAEAEAKPAEASRVGADDGAADEQSRSVIDRSRPGAAVLADQATALAVPEAPRTAPLGMAAMEKAGLVVGHKVRTRISEEFRITVGQVLRAMHASYSPGRGSPNVIMVTSARPGEGKSFSALNLAGSIAQHAQREVILVDVDAKQRSLSAELGLSDRPGLLDLSSTPALRIEDVILPTVIPHLSVLTIGAGSNVSHDISPTRPVSALVERIARRYPNAVVMLDAPPCLSTSEPSTLAPFVGQIVMVVEAERTQRNELVAALDLVQACPSVTLMLNKIKLTTSYTFGAYHYFGTYS
jgi:protein-tyrosine kinase